MSDETREAINNYLKNPNHISKKTATKYLSERGYDIKYLKIMLLEALESVKDTRWAKMKDEE